MSVKIEKEAKKINFELSYKNVIKIILVVIVIIVGFFLLESALSDNKSKSSVVFNDAKQSSSGELNAPIIIHIKGAVKNPGMYKITGDYRLNDAVAAAGGLTDDADSSILNLAMFINDGDEIIIPFKNANPQTNTSDTSRSQIVISSGESTTAKVNINTATKEQLTTLPGIGETTADQIIQYRKYIKFSTKEDLKNVPGIGGSKYDALQEFITVK